MQKLLNIFGILIFLKEIIENSSKTTTFFK